MQFGWADRGVSIIIKAECDYPDSTVEKAQEYIDIMGKAMVGDLRSMAIDPTLTDEILSATRNGLILKGLQVIEFIGSRAGNRAEKEEPPEEIPQGFDWKAFFTRLLGS